MAFHERLSALDTAFLGIESTRVHMHVGALLILEAGPLRGPDGGVDFERLASYIEGILDGLPRYRQRLEWVPGLRHPVWVDDDAFDLAYHLRHTALPRPGDERQLKRLAGRIFSQKLDLGRPLWEIWVVEGLAGDRFALVPKIHHSMIDGMAGVEFMSRTFRGTPDTTMPAPTAWEPRPAPSAADLLKSELGHRAEGARAALSTMSSAEGGLMTRLLGLRETAQDVATTLTEGLRPASQSPLNPPRIGPSRRFDVLRQDLGAVKAVKDAHGAKLNDVVLATTAGALGRFLERRGARLEDLQDFRAFVPVNIRSESQRASAGNHVAFLLAHLPVAERDPVRRLQAVRDTMDALKAGSPQVRGASILEELSDVAGDFVLRDLLRVASRMRAYNVVVTNVPGPPFPLYLLGARVEALYPMVPLFEGQGLGVALFSYAGGLHWGLSADRRAVPDVHELADDLASSFEELSRG